MANKGRLDFRRSARARRLRRDTFLRDDFTYSRKAGA